MRSTVNSLSRSRRLQLCAAACSPAESSHQETGTTWSAGFCGISTTLSFVLRGSECAGKISSAPPASAAVTRQSGSVLSCCFHQIPTVASPNVTAEIGTQTWQPIVQFWGSCGLNFLSSADNQWQQMWFPAVAHLCRAFEDVILHIFVIPVGYFFDLLLPFHGLCLVSSFSSLHTIKANSSWADVQVTCATPYNYLLNAPS